MHPQAPHSPEEIRLALDEVIEEVGGVDRPPTWPEKIAEWIGDIFEWIGDKLGLRPESAQIGFDIIYWGMIGLACLLILFIVFRIALALRRGERLRAGTQVLSKIVATRLQELYGRAAQAEREQDWVKALRLYYFALVVGLGERGDIEYRDAWTNRELLERGGPDNDVRQRLEPLLTHLDAVSFGDESASEDDVQDMEGLCRLWLGKDVA